MRISPHPSIQTKLKIGLSSGLHSPEVDRLQYGVLVHFLGSCPYMLDAKNNLLFQERGQASNWIPFLDGVRLPAELTKSDHVGACDPVTKSIVTLNLDSEPKGYSLWSHGQKTQLPTPPEMASSAP